MIESASPDLSISAWEYPELPDFPVEVHEEIAPYFPGRSVCDASSFHCQKGKSLPHWQVDAVIYDVCFRLSDSMPQEVLREWVEARQHYQQISKEGDRRFTADEMKQLRFLYSDKVERYLDSGYGECLLKRPEIAQIVQGALEFYDNIKYTLHVWCIMPNHLHVVFQLLTGYELQEILQGWKSYTAHAANRRLGRVGAFWQADYYNHIIRTEKEYFFQLQYVWDNPVRAGLEKWEWRRMLAER